MVEPFIRLSNADGSDMDRLKIESLGYPMHLADRRANENTKKSIFHDGLLLDYDEEDVFIRIVRGMCDGSFYGRRNATRMRHVNTI